MPHEKPHPARITLLELQEKMMALDVPDEELAPYLELDFSENGPFGSRLTINEQLVDMTEDEKDLESAMGIANGFARMRRVGRAKRDLRRDKSRPLIVSEGDSWFQFPIFLKDVVDQLGSPYITWGVGAAGDTAANMVHTRQYRKPLRKHGERVKAFLFSGAGNDIIGEDASGQPVLMQLIRGNVQSDVPKDYLDTDAVNQRFSELRRHYETVIADVRSILPRVPIVLHGYDYVFPGSKKDPRNPIWAKPDQWLGSVMSKKQVQGEDLQRDIIKLLIDRVYDMLGSFECTDPNTFVVDVRNTLPSKSDWADEIHPTNEGFARVAALFREKIER